jgi:hypothetical protein
MNNPPKVYREVLLPSLETINTWREFILSNEPSDVQETEKNFFGSGYAFKNVSKSAFTRNRFIVWCVVITEKSFHFIILAILSNVCLRRVMGETLELIDISLDLNLRGNAIRYHLNQQISIFLPFHSKKMIHVISMKFFEIYLHFLFSSGCCDKD